MPAAPRQRVIDGTRRALVRLASRHAGLRRLMERTSRELAQAAESGRAELEVRESGIEATYVGSYFGEGRDTSGDRQGRSGYARYDRIASNADIAGWLLWRNFQVSNALDVGCATGYLVEVLRERGIDAEGCDVSQFAVDHAAPGAAGHIRVVNLFGGLPWEDRTFELVTALEILEHLPPERVATAIRELARVCGGYLYATIPSFGVNESGQDGHFEGKVRPERVAYYRALGPEFDGPVPEQDLAVDADGHLVEGHLTIASFRWWTAQFAAAGLTRRPEIERRLYADVAPAGLEPFWNMYVLEAQDVRSGILEPRRPELSLAELGLDHPLLEAANG
jgi:SAM-dependent methyltransferase